MPQIHLTAEIKKSLFKIYNDVNKSIYGFGTNKAKIYAADNLIIFSVHHNRVPCLVALEEDNRALKELVDSAIMKVFKERLAQKIEELLQTHPTAVLRDYAYQRQIAITVVAFEPE